MRRLSHAELLLQEFGVTRPNEIDLEAIAWARGVRIKHRSLDNCEARIFAKHKKAIISVDDSQSSPRRIRFSIGHELGHWELHQGQNLFCRADDLDNPGTGKFKERAANEFASDLLLQTYVLHPIARSYKNLTTKTIEEISNLLGL